MKTFLVSALFLFSLAACSQNERISEVLQRHNNSLYSNVTPSVYKVIVDSGIGSGWTYGQDYIVTNKHVANADSGRILVENYSGLISVADFVGSSDKYDITVLKMPSLRPIEIPLSEEISIPGDLVYAFGNPNGLSRTMTEGIVTGPMNGEFITHSAGIGPGSSGGPLVSYEGDVVGMNTMVLNSQFGVDLGFAINSIVLEDEIQCIINGREDNEQR